MQTNSLRIVDFTPIIVTQCIENIAAMPALNRFPSHSLLLNHHFFAHSKKIKPLPCD